MLVSCVTEKAVAVNVAWQPALHSALILTREVASSVSANMYASSGCGMCGKEKEQAPSEEMVLPFGRLTVTGAMWASGTDMCESERRSRM